MQISRFPRTPFPAFGLLGAIEQDLGLLERMLGTATAPRGHSVSMTADDAGYRVSTALPGIDPARIDVTVQEGVLAIGVATRTDEGETGAIRTLFRVPLPADADGERITAHAEHGVLGISVPRVPRPAARRITVTLGQAPAIAAEAQADPDAAGA